MICSSITRKEILLQDPQVSFSRVFDESIRDVDFRCERE
jgi:hypothetical protein